MVIASLPLVCIATLHSLEESLDGQQSLCRNFVCRYVEMWPGRFERLRVAVMAGHHAEAMDAALSLRSSSLMVGAAQVGELSTDLIRLLEGGRHAEATKKLAMLGRCGNQTACQLTSSYVNVA